MELTELLKHVPIFHGLSAEQIDKLNPIISVSGVRQGTLIIKDGDRGDEMFVLLDGEVEISKNMTIPLTEGPLSHREKSLIRLTSKHYACFGEMALFEENSERSATVTAVTDCKLAMIRREDFTRIVETDTHIGFIVFRNLARIISDRLRKANKDILKLTTAFILAIQK